MARRHGFNATYVHASCRCDECRAAHAAASLDYARRNREKVRARRKSATCPDCGGLMSSGNGRMKDPERCDPCYRKRVAAQHGTASKYNGGCRCDACRRANTDYHREYMRQRRQVAA